ncbi:MAG: plasmid pRiA4b ORF-3 family protein [Phycisphaerae bacterium]|nr:plasmid pRiA4b ORF-3 family protein [Phycisphaerae bacterium]
MTENAPPYEFTETWPSPIVRDFDLFLEAIEAPSAYLTAAKRTLDRKTLHALDGQMLTFRTDTHPRTDQEYYLLLNFFQRVCMNDRLHVFDKVGAKLRMVPTERAAELMRLSPAGRFLALLEAAWVYCDWEALHGGGSRQRTDPLLIEMVLDALGGLHPGKALAVGGRLPANLAVLSAYGHPFLVHLGLFGLVEHTRNLPMESRFHSKGDICLKTVTVTPFGAHVLKVLREDRPISLWNLPGRKHDPPEFPGQSREPGDGGVEVETPFADAFRPLLPSGADSLVLPTSPTREWREGTYVVEVSLGPVRRTIALSDEHTLEALHQAIQDAFNFDSDHLYAFYMDGKRYSDDRYEDPRGDVGPFADEAAMGAIDLFVGQEFLYLFDFGDCWEFRVRVREVLDALHRGSPKVIAAKGDPPPQYSWDDEGEEDWDEDEDEDDEEDER